MGCKATQSFDPISDVWIPRMLLLQSAFMRVCVCDVLCVSSYSLIIVNVSFVFEILEHFRLPGHCSKYMSMLSIAFKPYVLVCFMC